MDDKQQNNKRPREIDEEPDKIKAMKRVSTEAKSITNIYYDCLERIFDFLDLKSLLNVASTCKRLQIAAAAKFSDIYGKAIVHLLIADFGGDDGYQLDPGNNIRVTGIKCCLPFLRCFGAKIADIAVNYDSRAFDENDYADRYINQYCANTLKTFSFCGGFSVKKFKIPFKTVENVYISHFELEDRLPSIGNWFPNLRQLDLMFFSADENATEIRIPLLEKLAVLIDDTEFSLKSLLNILHTNSKLQYLELRTCDDREIKLNELLDTINKNPAIIKLKILNGFTRITNVSRADLVRFAIERPFMVELHFPRHWIAPDDATFLIEKLKSLKLLKFQIEHRSHYDRLVNDLDNEWKHKCEILSGNNNMVTLERQN